MSDEHDSNPPRAKLAVRTRDFVRFLNEKSPESDCPVCGFDQWTVICPGPEGDTYRIVAPLRDGDKSVTISTFAIHCENCGYLRHHVSKVVKRWADANPEEPELDFDPAPGEED
jgi:hypothetical protein